MQQKKKHKSVLRASSLKTLVKLICRLSEEDSFTYDNFKAKYFKIRGREVSDKTLEDYLYTATKLKLIVSENGLYRTSKFEVEKLCSHMRSGAEDELRKYLTNILVNRDEVFSNFLNFLKQKPRDFEELEREFNPQSARTMLGWSNWLGITSENRIEHTYYLIRSEQEMPSLEEFWEVLIDCYEKLRETKLIGVKGAYIKIPDLREVCRSVLGLSQRYFDLMLQRLLSEKKYFLKIELAGAPVAFITQDKGDPFEYHGKIYYFIAFRLS